MNAPELAELLPKAGTIAISGGRLERELISAVAYANTEGATLRLIPLSPLQIRWATEMDIPVVRGYPTYFILQAEYKGPDYLLQSITDSVFADRIMSKMAEHFWAFVTNDVKRVLVEAVPQFIDYTLDELSLYGEIVDKRRNIFISIFHRIIFHALHI
jgi:hypothetical protein